MTLDEMFEKMPEFFNADAAGDMEATIFFDLTGDNGGQYQVVIADGACSTAKGAPEESTATIRMDGDDYKDMVAGRLNAMTAFMTGKVKVEGDLATVMKYQQLFTI